MTESTITIVKSTAPIIKSKGSEITSTMYQLLFEKYPAAKALFKDAQPTQQQKLADAIYAYSANIDRLENLAGGINDMALSHVRTKILPEHYPWVRESLMEAIRCVLGDAATEEIVNAWTEAYDFLAGVLIAREKELYESL